MYGSIGKLGLAGIRCATNQAIAHCVVNPDLVTSEYFMLALRSMRGALLARGQGGTQANISQTIHKSWPITLPPVDEQPQIVAKVDELMSLCDQLEAAQKERELHRTALRAVSLHPLPATPAEGDTTKNINFFLKRSERLITLPEHVAEVRQCILELAVRGRLVANDAWVGPTMASASRVSNAIVTPDLFDIPRRWHWGTLASVSTRIHYGYTASADLSTRDIRLLRITDIQNGRVNWESVPGCVISEEEAAKFLLSEGDILIARTGGTMGKSFLVTAAPVRAVFASYLIRVQPSTTVDRRYLKLFLESPLYWQQLSAASRGTGQPNVNGKTLGGLVIPFPPLDEQSRIVETVDSLISLCGGLEEALTSAHFERGRLLEALLRDALSGGGAPPELDEAVVATA
jgi:type I restriction enzyme S subunit